MLGTHTMGFRARCAVPRSPNRRRDFDVHRSVMLLAACAALALCAPKTSRADVEWVTVFRDDFNGSQLAPASWQVLSTNGVLTVNGGFLQLRSGGRGFPSLTTAYGIVPTVGSFRLRFGFRYGRTTCLGTRIGAIASGIAAPSCPYDPSFDPAYYGFKRDCAGSNAAAYPSGLVSACGYVPIGFADASGYHIGEIVYASGSIAIALDGVGIANAPGPVPRPSAIFLGWGTDGYDYTEYDLDFVEVQAAGGVTSEQATSWGRVKSLYR